METRLLNAYLAVLDAGSVTQAARELGYTQPAISLQLATLEQLLGAPLLRRGAHPLTPTPLGERIYPHARATVLLIQDLLDVAQQRSRTDAAG